MVNWISMKNKRLTAILILFVFVASLAVTTGTVFVVRTYTVSFRNWTLYIDSQAAESTLRAAIAPHVSGRNILFGLNRNLITETIETEDPRVRVTNIEARFPNRLEIMVRERYPQFVYRSGGNTLILDSRLRIVYNRSLSRNLIDISGEFNLPIADAQIGKYLMDYIPETTVYNYHYLTKMERLVGIGQFFENRRNREDALTYLFSTIEFCTIRGGLDVRLMIASITVQGQTRTEIIVHDIQSEVPFFQMLTAVWHVKEQESRNFPGQYRAFFDSNGQLTISSPRQVIVSP